MVVLHPLPPAPGPLPDHVADDDFVVALDDGAVLARGELGGAGLTGEVQACFGDVVVGDRVRLRPAWSPTRAVTDPGSVLPLAVRAAAVRRGELDPRDPGLALDLVEAGATVAHVPAVLTTHGHLPSGPGPERLDAHLARLGVPARVVAGARPDTWRLMPHEGFRPRITVIVPTAGAAHPDGRGRAVDRVLDGLTAVAEAGQADLDVVVVVGDEFRGDPAGLAADGPLPVTLRRRRPGPFDFAAAVNQGLLAARGERVLLLNDDIEVSDPAALRSMALHLEDETVGAVGALLRYPDGTLQHAGVVIDDARPLHPFVGSPPATLAAAGADVARDVVAVTGACLLARRADLLAVGGLSTDFPLSFNDVDLCVRLRRAGRRIVIEPDAVFVHHETLTRDPVIDAAEWERWIARWGEIVDPWYHPGYHRPDDPADLRRNADHLAPTPSGADAAPAGPVVARTPTLRSRVHRSRLPGGALTYRRP